MKGLLEETPKKTYKRSKIYLILGVLTLIITSIGSTLKYYQNQEFIRSHVNSVLSKEQQGPLRPPNFGSGSNSAERILNDEEFKYTSLKKLSGAIQIETESYDNNPFPSDDLEPWLKFFKFHDFLKESFPLVHKHLSLEKPNKIALLYTWQGSNPDLKPLLLTAHQDVVPVDPSSSSHWKFPPYSGHFDGDSVWGRGSLDCKTFLIGILEAIETLIEDGFQPERTIVLGFGNDEESGGNGAASINSTLTDRYGSDSFFALLDEGLGIQQIDGEWYASPATSEKGHLTISIKLTTPGGHSSIPPEHTSIGIAAKLIALLEDNPFKPTLSFNNPFFKLLQEVAKHSENLSESVRNDILRAEVDPAAKKRLIEYLIQDPKTRYLIQTSQAVDVIHGGVKSNALPEFVEIVYNSRISIDSSVNETTEHILDHVQTISNEFDLGLYYDGNELISRSENGYFNITVSASHEALNVSPSEGVAWDVLAGTIKHVWGELVFKKSEDIFVGPTLFMANTDTKRYTELTPNIYRFFPFRFDDLAKSGAHSVDEHIKLDYHLESVAFLYEFILNVENSRE